MKFCSKCLYPENHPLGITFDEHGVCSGCRVHEEKNILDWSGRREKLKKIFKQNSAKKSSRYDCIVPISGGRDSFFIMHLVKKVYGLNPLVVMYNRHYNTRAGIYNIARLRTLFGCDIYTLTLDPGLIKRIMNATLVRAGSFHWHTLAGASVFPVQVAVNKNIPLIIWGAHQGIEQVGMYSHLDEVEMTRRYRKEHDLMGLEPEDLVGSGELAERELMPFFYPSDNKINQIGVTGIYLGNYHRWDTKAQHEEMVKLYGQYQGSLNRTFDSYNDIDDMHFTGMHDLLKVRKFGYGKIVDDASREIRYGRLSRTEGIKLVSEFENNPPLNASALTNFLGMNHDELLRYADPFRDTMLINDRRTYATKLLNNKPQTISDGIELFGTHMPEDFEGNPNDEQLLSKGYAKEK